jgi:hypothetical protein
MPDRAAKTGVAAHSPTSIFDLSAAIATGHSLGGRATLTASSLGLGEREYTGSEEESSAWPHALYIVGTWQLTPEATAYKPSQTLAQAPQTLTQIPNTPGPP